MKEIWQGFFQKKHFGIRLVTVMLAVLGMGFSLSFLLLVDLGADPCTMMNRAISMKLGMTFGNWQALLNVILLVIVVIFGGKNLGFGTLANMILIGYYADFFTWLWGRVFPENLFQSMQVRIGVLIPAVIVFILFAALYMDVDMGTAPYDAIPIIISDHLPKVPFRVIRMCVDLTATILGLVFGGKLGIMTVIMVVTLGPVIQWMGNILKKYFPVLTEEG